MEHLYNWPEIVKEYPWAQWCATNECSKITWVYARKPSEHPDQFINEGGMFEQFIGHVPENYYKLESRPEGI